MNSQRNIVRARSGAEHVIPRLGGQLALGCSMDVHTSTHASRRGFIDVVISDEMPPDDPQSDASMERCFDEPELRQLLLVFR